MALRKLVLLRHGESEWNKQNRFTGWVDNGLSAKGKREAREAAALLKKNGFAFDVAFTSVLKRAVDTTKIVLREMGLRIPVEKSWRLNERHYGALQGLNKAETAAKYGEAQVKLWRRDYSARPPALSERERLKQAENSLFASIPKSELPASESLKDTYARVVPYWKKEIAPAIKNGKRVLVSAHGNSLRALVKYLNGVSDEDISELNIPTGVPLVYELDDSLKPLRRYYLGDADAIKKKMNAVKNQARAR
ncbi:MAG: 2,3-diphosphoglycerate-dependent phosphoglycerate mutase [Candidatus Norongarragalinales archaeon]